MKSQFVIYLNLLDKIAYIFFVFVRFNCLLFKRYGEILNDNVLCKTILV